MKILNIIFYEIKLRFLWQNFNNNILIDKKFIKFLNNSDFNTVNNKYGWIINSFYIKEYWNEIKDESSTLFDYYEFLNEYFIFLDERIVSICDKCKLSSYGKKIKLS